LGLPIGKHLSIEAPNPNLGKGTWNGAEDKEKNRVIVRKYTPTPTDSSNIGYCDLVIKTYRPGTLKMPDGSEKTWENGGRMSLYMDSLNIGDSINISGPIGLHEYFGRGKFKGGGKVHEVKYLSMMAGGTGITPMLQIANAVIQDKGDKTKMALIYANKTEDDILCRDIIDDLVEKSEGQLKVYYTLDFPPADWKGKTGFISADMIKDCAAPPSAKPLILMCGPPPMLAFTAKNLDQIGYAKDMRVQF
jgi:cytochrome-b5 reductase